MPKSKEHLEELLSFIKEHRSNESNFEKIYDKITNEQSIDRTTEVDKEYYLNIKEIKEKQAAEYLISKENNGNAWPEFEKFVSAFEKAITGAMNGNEA